MNETHGAKLAKIELKKKFTCRRPLVGSVGPPETQGGGGGGGGVSGLTWKKKGMGGSYSSKIPHVYVHIWN